MPNIGGTEWVILLLMIALLPFGASKLPGLARGLGEGIREFRKSLREPVKEEPRELPPLTLALLLTGVAIAAILGGSLYLLASGR